MKRKTKNRYLIFSMIAVMIFMSVPNIVSEAGMSEIVIDSTSFEETLDSQLWNDKDGDISVEDGVIVIPNDSTGDTGLISKKVAKVTDKTDKLLNAETTFWFTQLPQGEKMAFALGLQSVSSEMEEAGNVEIIFTNNDALKVSVVAYDSAGEATVIKDETSCGSLKSKVNVACDITADKMLTVTVNGKQLCESELPVSGEGRVGFVQSGNCGVRIEDVKIVSYKYDNPTNVDIEEDFEEGTLNTSTMVSKTVIREINYVDTNIGIVEQEDGNHVFEAKHATPFYIGARYQYSNFELTFDVPYIQKAEILDSNNEVISPATTRFAISFGGESMDSANYHYDNAADLLIFSKDSSILSYHTGNRASAVQAGYPFFDKDVDKAFSVRLSVIDSVIKVGLKWIDEENYTDVLTYQISQETPLGYVHIWSLDMGAVWAIDNFKLVNKDVDPQLEEVEFESDLMQIPDDYDYQPAERIYKPEEKDFNAYLMIPICAAVCIVGFGIAWITNKRSKKSKGGVRHAQEDMEKSS